MVEKEQARPATKTIKRASRTPGAATASAKPPLTKVAQLQARLQHADGASLKQLGQEFGWQAHSVRAAISGLRKAGFVVQRGVGDQSSVYRIVGSGAA